MSRDVINEGDWVLIYFNDKKSYTVKVEKNRLFHTTMGSIDLGSLIGKRLGEQLETNVGEKFYVTAPTLIDKLGAYKRFTQVIYPKDLAYILLSSGIGPGSRVVEAGTGTGYLTSVLAFYVRPSGRVYTYENREEFYRLAIKNFEKIGLIPYITARRRDIRQGIKEEDVDAVFLDMPDPWTTLDHAFKALKHGGVIVIFLPTITQVSKTLGSLRAAGFKRISVAELMERRYKTSPKELRPENIGVWHTGYIISAQKL